MKISEASKAFEARYKNLNVDQKKAVNAIEGPVMVIAGPGSGKTEILSLRVANILQKTQQRPNNILCLTFTDLAAVNMRKRMAGLLGTDAYRVAVHTFHSFCVDIMERFPEFFYNGASFVAADDLVQIQILEEIIGHLPYDNPLKVFHPEEGLVYLKDAKIAIANLKKAGITPGEFLRILDHNEESLVWANPFLDEVFSARVNQEVILKVEKLVKKLKERSAAQLAKKPFPVPHLKSFLSSLIDSLELLGERAARDEKPTSLYSEWKQEHLEKSEGEAGAKCKLVCKETVRLPRLRALADLYEKYQKLMWERGYYDFDDMILNVMLTLEKNETLRYQVQEQFQYILVDEFQDTNDGQMRLLRAITDAPQNEGRPNIMVVGDDDQAIYKFQGAEISNILNFSRLYNDATIVTMVQNYRSTQTILDLAQHVIRKGTMRLEKILPNIEKTLTSHNKKLTQGKIINKNLASSEEEFNYVAAEIKKLIDQGMEPSQIAVISRKHEILESLVPHLQKAGVPIRYERQQNVLHEPHIHQIIEIARFISSYARKDVAEADDLLPEILSYPFWNLKRIDVWKVSLSAKEDCWLSAMRKSENERVREIADFLLDLSVRSLSEPLEYIVDRILGAHIKLIETDDEEENFASPFDDLSGKGDKTEKSFHSPFKSFYFSKERFEKQKGKYLTFLSSLRVFMYALREYKKGEILSIQDLVSYVDTHEENGLLVTDNSPYISALSAVNLLSAHKAKGLEFKAVFVLACQDSVWMSRGRGTKLPMPLNMPIAPAGDNFDDKLRLFFVAITRAKEILYITSATNGDNGGAELPLQFIADLPAGTFQKNLLELKEGASAQDPDPQITDILADSWRLYHRPPTTIDETALLATLVENYQMSVTHLINFLDVTNGGPQYFLETNLLRFPQAKTASSAYGTAVHATIERLYFEMRGEAKLPTLAKVLGFFKEFLRKERLGEREYKEQEERGIDALTAFYKSKKDTFKPEHRLEINFKNQGVIVEEAHLSGKIDKMERAEDGSWRVHDYKTGSAVYEWKGKTEFEKIKLHKYKQQLIFYKLLVENSRDYGDKEVKSGVIEFVEPEANGRVIDLPLKIEGVDVERLKKLIAVVYKKIIALDFPDITKYPPTEKGIMLFEDDLLSTK